MGLYASIPASPLAKYSANAETPAGWTLQILGVTLLLVLSPSDGIAAPERNL